MKAKYIFSHETGAITTETVFYTVYIGDSAYGQRLLQRCQALTFSTNYFFAKADAKTSEFLLNVAQSLYPGVTLPLLRLNTVQLSEREFSKLLTQKVFRRETSSQNSCVMLCQLDSQFYAAHHTLWSRK